MANYDDIFNASAQKGTEDKSFVSFNKEEWAAQKKQDACERLAALNQDTLMLINDAYRMLRERDGD